MSKKGFKKLGANIKRFASSKAGKIVKGAVLVGGGLLAANALSGGVALKAVGGGVKKLLGKSAKNQGGRLRGLFAKKKDKSRGLNSRLDVEQKQDLVKTGIGSLDRKLKRFKRSGLSLENQKEDLQNVLTNVQKEIGQNPDFAGSPSYSGMANLNADVQSYSPDYVSEDRQVSDVEYGEKPDMLKAGLIVGGSIAGLYGLGKLTGIIK